MKHCKNCGKKIESNNINLPLCLECQEEKTASCHNNKHFSSWHCPECGKNGFLQTVLIVLSAFLIPGFILWIIDKSIENEGTLATFIITSMCWATGGMFFYYREITNELRRDLLKEKAADKKLTREQKKDEEPFLSTREITEDDIISSLKKKMSSDEISIFSIEDLDRLLIFLKAAREKEKERKNIKTIEIIDHNFQEISDYIENDKFWQDE